MQTIDDYLTQLSSSRATPGGGSAAMFVAATGAALLAMVARISAEKQKRAEKRASADRIAGAADRLRHQVLAAAAQDEAAFEAVMAAQRRPKADAERAVFLEAALSHAADVPLQSADQVLDGLKLAREAIEVTGENLMSDLGCAAEFLSAALRACAYTVRVNLAYMTDARAVGEKRASLEHTEAQANVILKEVRLATETALMGSRK